MPAEQITITGALLDHMRRIRPLLRPERGRIVLGMLFTLAGIGLTLVYPQVFRIIVDEGIQGGNGKLIQQMTLVMIAILLIDGPSTYLRVYLFSKAGQRAASRLAVQVQRNVMRQEIGFFDGASPSEISSRITRDSQSVANLVSNWLPEGLRFSLFAVFGMGLMIYTSPKLSLIVMAVAPVLAVTTSVLGKLVHRRQASESIQLVKAGAQSHESISSIRTVRAYDREEFEAQRLEEYLSAHIKAGDKRAKVTSALESVTTFSSEAGIVVGLWAGGHAIVAGTLTAGQLVSFIFYAGLVVRSFKNLSRFGADVMRLHGVAQRVYELCDREPLMPEGKMIRPSAVAGTIRLENVRFRYPLRPDVQILKGLDLEIRAGEFLAIVGPSGMGKSTLGNLIVRYYDPEAGHVYFDGHDVRDLDPAWLREQVTMVQQDSTLFSRSIDENTRFGSEDASSDEVAAVLEATGADEFIRRQSDGIQTLVGDRGVAFSGGQRQRLAISRALLRKPKVLILDEATSALDAESETLLKESLRKLEHHPTLIMVAHRLSTVIDADRVVVIHDGKVAGAGSHTELMRSSQIYRDLVDSQLVSE